MNDMIHSAAIVHQQRATEVARNAEYARRRAEREAAEPIASPTPARPNFAQRLARFMAAHLPFHHVTGRTARAL